MLNPILKKNTRGDWYLYWTADPGALAYDIQVSWQAAHIQSGKDSPTKGVKLGKPTEPFWVSVDSAHTLGNPEIVNQPPVVTPPPPPSYSVQSSIAEGAVLTSPVTWEAIPSGPTTKVEFYIDGQKMWQENISPYVFNGDGALLDPHTLSNGDHQLIVSATSADGVTVSTTIRVNVNVTAPPVPSGQRSAGDVDFAAYLTRQYGDVFTLSPPPTQAQKDQMNKVWPRGIIYMDSIAYWLDGDWGYNDMLAIYTSQTSLISAHPDWLVKDIRTGQPMKFYSDVQYLCDPTNPSYQDFKAQQIAAMVARNYKGVHCDDVNTHRPPELQYATNPATGKVFTEAEWNKGMADMMTKVRQMAKAAKSDFEIVHNSKWWSSGTDADRCWMQCDIYEVEGGFNGNDPLQVWKFADKVHAAGKGMNFLSEATGQQAAMFNLACALMCSNGSDYIFNPYNYAPNAFDPMWSRNLGDEVQPRRDTGGNVWRRDFKLGYVVAAVPSKTGSIVLT